VELGSGTCGIDCSGRRCAGICSGGEPGASGDGAGGRLAAFLPGVYNGFDYPFYLSDLRPLDTKLANACLGYLNYNRLGVFDLD
jgi:hypothetical protein